MSRSQQELERDLRPAGHKLQCDFGSGSVSLIEVTFEESRAHLGIETQRQWNDQAIERTTPALFGLFSLVALLGHALYPDGQLPLSQSAWYHKTEASFSDVLALVRQALWGNFNYQTSPTNPDMVLIPRTDLDRLAFAVCY